MSENRRSGSRQDFRQHGINLGGSKFATKFLPRMRSPAEPIPRLLDL